MDDLNTDVTAVYLTPTLESTRFYRFDLNTIDTPLRTGEYVLRVYEKANEDNFNITNDIKFISKVRIYKTFPADNFNNLTLSDERLN